MFSPRWKKLLRDLWLMRGRMAMMAIAIGVSLLALAAVLTAYTVLTREISLNYLGTSPAAATIDFHGQMVDETLVDRVRALPGVANAEARASVNARIQVRPGAWETLLLFVVRDFDKMRVGTFRSDSGAWPPATGEILLERTVLPMYNLKVGDELGVKTPQGSVRTVKLSGTVHDPGLAPAWQERMGYAYATEETMAWLGETGGLDELKILFDADTFDEAEVTRKTLEVVAWLKADGYEVEGVRIPPPGKHPHQAQMEAVLILFLVFSLFALILSGILAAAMIDGILAKEVRQIGVMKAVGASTGQIAGLYVVLILFVSLLGLAWGVPLGFEGGKALYEAVSELLNFTIYSTAVPHWVFVILVIAGLGIPFLVALVPILRASGMSVRESISDYGVVRRSRSIGQGKILRVFREWGSRGFLLVLRNAFRRRGRLLLTLGLLAAGGAVFMTALNVQSAWDRLIQDSFESRSYDFALRLREPQEILAMKSLLESVPGVRRSEAWGYVSATPLKSTAMQEISKTYPDEGHGSFTLKGIPYDTDLIRFPLLAGRWLQAGDQDAIVLAQGMRSRFQLGESMTLVVEGRKTSWTVVGFVKEIGPASAYVTEKAFQQALNVPGRAAALFVVAEKGSPESKAAVLRQIEKAFEERGIAIHSVISDSDFREALIGHIAILIFTLVALALLMSVVGFLGLASSMGNNVVERTRELGVMRTIGATPGVILRNIIGESVFIGLLSLIGSWIASLPISGLLGDFLGKMAFQVPLSLTVSGPAIVLWTLLVILGSAAASAWPAYRASRLSIRETLSYE